MKIVKKDDKRDCKMKFIYFISWWYDPFIAVRMMQVYILHYYSKEFKNIDEELVILWFSNMSKIIRKLGLISLIRLFFNKIIERKIGKENLNNFFFNYSFCSFFLNFNIDNYSRGMKVILSSSTWENEEAV